MRIASESCRCGFEELEARKLLAAGTFVGAATDATSLAVVIDYTGVDPATIGAGDITFAANGRSPVAATVVASTQSLPGGVLRVRYGIPAYDGAWGTTDTGTYTIASPAGAVTDANGHNLQFTNLASIWMWFATPKARLVSQTMRATDWLIVMQYDSLGGINESTLDGSDIAVSGGTPSSIAVSQIIHVSATTTKVVYAIGAPGGAWSYASNGTYSISMVGSQVLDNQGRAAPAHALSTYYLWFAAPRVEFVDHSVGATDWTVTVRISARPGSSINPASIVGNGAIYASGPNGYLELGHNASLIHNVDGSYTATFSIVPNGGSWDWMDTGSYTVKVAAGRIRDAEGNAAGGGTLASRTLTFSAPAARMVLPTHPTSTLWNIQVDFTDDVNINLSSISVASVRLLGPDGGEIALALQSVTFAFPGVARATFRLNAPGGIENGNYQVWVNDQGARDTTGTPVAENQLGSFWLWFP